eukprot:CAMPEP_0198286072 /NCGR_PEP_ID=MMETSP1449-20131203/5227_1 /TAXON_ID=420275 /ORGANISM="Attheya septentrionalis, Strain CCMP2084" /LENGTH=716 /DNA_ID=CAMNT_0043983693 /DNA_START=180 /DNA_END=2330 /DNA_ORIENTATION=+
MIASTPDATTSALSENNPLLCNAKSYLPRFSEFVPEQTTGAMKVLLPQMESALKELEERLEKETNDITYDNVLPAVERIQDPVSYAWGMVGHLNGVQNGPALRAEYEQNQATVVQSFTAFSQSQALYKALQTLQTKFSSEEDDESFHTMQQKRAIDNALRGMTLGGVGLEGKAKERFNEIKIRLAELSTQFRNNVLDSTKDFSLTVEDPEIMEGVPASSKAMWAQAHQKHSSEEERVDPDVGPWRITLDMPSYLGVMQYIPDRSTREIVNRAFNTRASDGERNNVPLIEEILELRAESSKLLGFSNFADRSLASKMASSVQEVTNLSQLIADAALPRASKELADITAFAKERGGSVYQDLDKLMPWDVAFWSERYKEETFAITKEQLRPYFALPEVLDGLFALINRLFGVTIEAADDEAEKWNKDVRFFKVFDDKDKKHIASFFLDPYSRPADKRGGAWMASCVGKSEACDRDVPVAYLNCNNSPPIGDDPSLMTFEEVRTLFHETGHGLQHMLTEAVVGDVSGISGVEWDAVELPSQFMENWLYDKSTIYGFAKHYQTGEPLPEEYFEKLVQQKTYNAGLYFTRQLYLGQMDMALHSDFDASKESIFDVQKRVASKFIPHQMPLDGDRFLCAFAHVFAGGYAAGYYSYKWAEVMSADSFSAFEELETEDQRKEMGVRFRQTVLALGGGMHPTQVFTKFRGRAPNPEALLRHNGLA